MGVTIRRGKLPTDNFTIIPNDYARDRRLSWGARGLLAWAMSHAESFKITEEAMLAAGPSKRDGIRRLVGELEEHGYLRRDKVFTPGVGTTVDYVLTDPYDGKSGVSDDGKSVVRADQAEQPVSAGQPYDGKSVPPSYIEDQKKTKETSSPKRSALKATRIPDDFQPDDSMRAWYRENIGSSINGVVEHEKFCDYWRAVPGIRGQKVDWPATWRNWMRTASERAGGRPGTALAPTSGAPYRPSTTDQKVAQTLELGRRLMEETA